MIKELSAHGRLTILPAAVAAAIVFFAFLGFAHAQSQKFQFAAIGDTAYSKRSEQEFDRMIAAMNRENLAFIVHVGDFEADPRPYERNPDKISMPCTDESFARVLASFQRSAHPLVLTPGDNDWSDCHLLKARKVDPLERLAKLREMFFPEGRSLGQRTMVVDSLAKEQGFVKFRENLTWTMNGVVFATLHTVGSNDNFGRTAEMDAEHAERKAANTAWMKKAFATARAPEVRGLVLLTQANVAFESHWTESLRSRYVRSAGGKVPKDAESTAYDALVDALMTEMESFRKPVLFVHGDTHLFRVNKPLISKKARRFFQNFTRVEVFGDPDTHWVRITVDPSKPELFTIEPEIIPENNAN
jgi:predicted phosphodiesterase